MLEGLPDNFHLAWLEVTRSGNTVAGHYRCMIEKVGEAERFQAADDLYPVQRIEHLDEHLPQKKREIGKHVFLRLILTQHRWNMCTKIHNQRLQSDTAPVMFALCR